MSETNIILVPRWASSSLALSHNAYVDCGTPVELSNLRSFTLEAWINTTAAYTTSGTYINQTIISNIQVGSVGQYQLSLNDNNLSVYIGASPYVFTFFQPLTAGQWYHVACVFEAGPPSSIHSNTSTLTLYIDGNQVAQQPFSNSITTSGTNVLIGATRQQNGNLTSYFQGQIGRVMMRTKRKAASSGSSLMPLLKRPVSSQKKILTC